MRACIHTWNKNSILNVIHTSIHTSIHAYIHVLFTAYAHLYSQAKAPSWLRRRPRGPLSRNGFLCRRDWTCTGRTVWTDAPKNLLPHLYSHRRPWRLRATLSREWTSASIPRTPSTSRGAWRRRTARGGCALPHHRASPLPPAAITPPPTPPSHPSNSIPSIHTSIHTAGRGGRDEVRVVRRLHASGSDAADREGSISKTVLKRSIEKYMSTFAQ